MNRFRRGPIVRAAGLISTALSLSFLLHAGPDDGRKPLAVVSAVVQEVARREAGKDWEQARRGNQLAAGDMMRTGPQSLAVVKFLDNSMIRLRERCEVTITGTFDGRRFLKAVDVGHGRVGFDVRKQREDEEFRFTSPTSVASIRGTDGYLASADTSDTVVVRNGAVAFSSKASGADVVIEAGFTGVAGRSGALLRRPSTREEQLAADDAVAPAERRKQLKLQLRNSKGETRELIIDYRD